MSFVKHPTQAQILSVMQIVSTTKALLQNLREAELVFSDKIKFLLLVTWSKYEQHDIVLPLNLDCTLRSLRVSVR